MSLFMISGVVYANSGMLAGIASAVRSSVLNFQ